MKIIYIYMLYVTTAVILLGAKHVDLTKCCSILARTQMPLLFLEWHSSRLIMWQCLVKCMQLPSAGVELQPLAAIDVLKTEALN